MSYLDQNLKSYTASREFLTLFGEWPLRNLQIDMRWETTIIQNMAMTWEAEYAKAFLQRIQLKASHKWPRDWWEAVKERWAPAWFKERWPVQYNSVEYDIDEPQYAICPYPREEKGQCLRWMSRVMDQGYAPHQELHKLEGIKLCGMDVFVDTDHPRRAHMAKMKLQEIMEELDGNAKRKG